MGEYKKSVYFQSGIFQNQGLLFTLVASFSSSFVLYLLTLAPTVTFEDSGELITAAYHLGIPHQPGYPLFTLLGRIFSVIPVGTIAYRLNLMSAFFTALGAMWLSWTIIRILDELYPPEQNDDRKSAHHKQVAKHFCALSASLLMVTAYETWEQSIITEVYGLNAMFTTLLLLLAVIWKQERSHTQRIRIYLLICYLLGLTFSNHTTSLMMLPILLVFTLSIDHRFLLSIKRLAMGIAFLLLGLTPYLYLPVASSRDPIMDWGNPENWTNFWRTITRSQYNLNDPHTWERFSAQTMAYLDMLLHQWKPWVLIFALIGFLGFIFRTQPPSKHEKGNRGSEQTTMKNFYPYVYLSLIFLFFAVPVTTYMTNFDVANPVPAIANENKALVSVFYIPSYIFFALLMGIGLYVLLDKILQYKQLFQIGCMAVVGIPILVGLLPNYSRLNMRHYYFTQEYVANLFTLAEPNSIIFANWDPFYFPLNYYQYVEGKRPDILALDQQLLRRSWYLQWLEDHYPDLYHSLSTPIQEFLTAVAPFENGEAFDANFIQQKYIGMINAIIEYGMQHQRAIYFTYVPTPDIAPRYRRDPQFIAYRLKKPEEELDDISPNLFSFNSFVNKKAPLDRMAEVFQNYYGKLFLERATQLESAQRWEEALELYNASLKFFPNAPPVRHRIKEKIAILQKLQN